MDISLSGPTPYGLPRCSCCNASVDGVAIFETSDGTKITRVYEAQCHGQRTSLVKLDGIEAPSIVEERHRKRLKRWDPFPTN